MDPKGGRLSFKNLNRIDIPDLGPGDKAIVFMWGNYSSLTFEDVFSTYSSAGRFRVTYDWPQSQAQEYKSGIGRFLDEYASIGAWITGILLVGFLAIMAGFFESYYKRLLSDDLLYQSERVKFLANPKKFVPDSKTSAPPTAPSES